MREFADETARRRLAESEHTHWPGRERDLRDAGDMAAADEIEYQAALLRDVIGNPFRRVTFHRAWRTSTAVALGRRMYESRDFTPMPNLADALRRAGCECAEVLAHCRGPGPHVRGCWVVDLVLGTE